MAWTSEPWFEETCVMGLVIMMGTFFFFNQFQASHASPSNQFFTSLNKDIIWRLID